MRTHERGFTLIELLIVVVIIGVLASIAIPKFVNTKDRANTAAMKSDLRNLATAQESYLYDYATYYDGAVPDPALSFRVTSGVTVTLNTVAVSGWAATAKHVGSLRICALFVGNVAPAPPATVEGTIACNPP
jgi:prepilin-type N-terminal cleavage/methylation domain-containing protein